MRVCCQVDASVPDDPEVVKIIAPYSEKVRELSKVIGRLEGGLSKTGVGGGSLGNFVTDAIRAQAQAKLGKPVVLAMMNIGGLRKNEIAAGELRASDIFELLPFENALVAVDVTGVQLAKILQVVTRDAQSGARIQFKWNDRDRAEFISGKLVDENGKEHEIDPNQDLHDRHDRLPDATQQRRLRDSSGSKEHDAAESNSARCRHELRQSLKLQPDDRYAAWSIIALYRLAQDQSRLRRRDDQPTHILNHFRGFWRDCRRLSARSIDGQCGRDSHHDSSHERHPLADRSVACERCQRRERVALRAGPHSSNGSGKRIPNTLLVDAGDVLQGTPYFNFYKGEVEYKAMSAIGYDVGTLGNHEFDNGVEALAAALKFANFDLVSANYDVKGTVLEATRQTLRRQNSRRDKDRFVWFRRQPGWIDHS